MACCSFYRNRRNPVRFRNHNAGHTTKLDPVSPFLRWNERGCREGEPQSRCFRMKNSLGHRPEYSCHVSGATSPAARDCASSKNRSVEDAPNDRRKCPVSAHRVFISIGGPPRPIRHSPAPAARNRAGPRGHLVGERFQNRTASYGLRPRRGHQRGSEGSHCGMLVAGYGAGLACLAARLRTGFRTTRALERARGRGPSRRRAYREKAAGWRRGSERPR